MRHIYNYLALIAVLLVFNVKVFCQASPYGVSLSGMEWGTSNIPGAAGTNYFLPTAQEFTYYKGKGLKLFRIPFLWERMQESLGGSLNSTYLSQLDGVVSAAATAGVSVFLDCHNYGRYNGNVITSSNGPTQAQYNNLWTQLATHYAGNTTVWGYDIMNEPHDLGGVNWMTIAQAAITAIRTVDATHTLIIEGDNWSHGNTWTTYNNNYYQLTDPNNNLVFEAHQYFDSDGSGNYTNNTVSGNGANSNTGVTLITPFVTWLKNNKVKGMVGEYGVPNTADQTNWNTLLTTFLTYLQTNCVMGTYWAGGPAWGTNALSCEPTNNYTTDASQMSVLKNFTALGTGCVSSSANITVAVSSSATNAAQGGNITLTATASTTSGSITQVAFYQGSTLIGTATSSPYTITWKSPALGSYQITAVATNSSSQTATSTAITVNVVEPIYSTTTAPTIDGVVESLWSNYAASSLNNVLTGTVSSSTYLSANWKATWDANNLYLLVAVTDDKLVNGNQPQSTIYNDDGIEIYIDMGNTKTTTYGSNQFRYTFRWNDATVYELQHSAITGVKLGQTSQGIAAGCTTNCAAQGYTMEVAIPWSTLGASAPAIGNLEGFDVAVNDDDDGTRDAKIAWNMTTDNDWQDPADFGAVIMEGSPCTPPTAIITPSGTAAFCTGGNVTLNANTGTGFTYQWSNASGAIGGATSASYAASATGTYTVAVKNSGNCSATSSATTVTANAAPTTSNAGTTQYITTTSTTLAANTPTNGTGAWSVVSGTGTFANSASATSSVSGLSIGANQFQWSITNGVCTPSTSTVTINVGTAPTQQTITGETSVTTNEQGVTYSVPDVAGDTYQWTLPAGATIASSNTDQSQITVDFGSTGGTLSVTETNPYGTSTSSLTINISGTTGVIGSVSTDSYEVRPNPFNSSTTIRLNTVSGSLEPLSVTITDLKGINCYSSSAYYTNEDITIGQQLSSGVYIVQLVYANQVQVVKLVKVQ